MQKVVWKLYFDFQKEEKWINDMADKGLSFVAYSPLRYVFEKTEPFKYQYKIDLLDKLPSHPESESYLEFLEENEIKVMSTSLRWVFLRKDNDGEAFGLCSSTTTKAKLYKSYLKMLFPIFIMNVIAAVVNIVAFAEYQESLSVFGVSVSLTISTLLGLSLLKVYKDYQNLKKDLVVFDD